MTSAHSHPVRPLRAAALVALVALLGLAATSSAGAAPRAKPVGTVYTQTNGDPNQVIAFDRYADGSLRQRQTVNTGGVGGHQAEPGCAPPPGCPILDAQNEVQVSDDGRYVFAVNAGSNSISSFRVTRSGLRLADVQPSGGAFPNSLTTRGNVVYALNTNSLTIAGFRVSSSGRLAPIAGSTRALSREAVRHNPRQIGFDRTGRLLVVTLFDPAIIDTFVVRGDGTPGSAVAHPSSTPLPFGFAFSPRNQLVVTQVHDLTGMPNSDVASYRLTAGGGVTSIDTKPDNGFAACWAVISRDGRYVYAVNTGGGAPSGATVSVFRMTASGALTLLQVTPVVNGPDGRPEFARTDEILSPDGRFLYVLTPAVFSATSRVDIYRVGGDGRLTFSGTSPSTMPPGVSGLAGAATAPAAPARRPRTPRFAG